MKERVATAIANRRAGRRGAPSVTNVLDLLKVINGGRLYVEVMDDADAAIEAMREPTEAMWAAVDVKKAQGDKGFFTTGDLYRAMIDAALSEPALSR